MAKDTLAVKGLADLNRAFSAAGKEARVEMRVAMQSVAKPVRERAAVLAREKIRRMDASPQWAGMRTGVTRHAVYVAPRQRGVRGRGGPRARPNLAGLLMNRAMIPALRQSRPLINARFNRVLAEIGKTWERT